MALPLFGDATHCICGVAAASTAREMQQLVRLALRLTGTVELRLDWLRNDQERKKFLDWLKRARLRNAVLLATCRRRIGGGEFSGDAGAELFWLMKAREAGCQWCDLEIETLRELPGETVRGYAVPEKVLLSIHDFRRTPRLTKKLNVPQSGGVDGVKVAAMARSITDSVRLLQWARKSPQAVAIPMGEIGVARAHPRVARRQCPDLRTRCGGDGARTSAVARVEGAIPCAPVDAQDAGLRSDW